jgi:hypothetical protein
VKTVFPALATNPIPAAAADQARVATIASMVLKGLAGAGTVSLAQFDYHTGNRATGEQRTFDAGALIGQALALAAAKKTPLMIYVFTDGAVTSSGQIDNSTGGRGKGVWTADSGQRSATYTIVYNPNGKRPEMRNGIRQIGAFGDGGTVDEAASKIGGSPDLAAKAIVANYLALHGKESMLASVVGSDPFGADLDKILAFAKLV